MRLKQRLLVLSLVMAASLLSAAHLFAQVVPTVLPRESVASIMALVSDGRSESEILQRVAIDCYTFNFEDLAAQIRRAKGPAGLTENLKRKCSRVLVVTDPARASLRVADHELGNVRPLGDMWWVDPGSAVSVTVALGSTHLSKEVDLPANRLVQIEFSLPKDTTAWPAVRAPLQIARERNLFEGLQLTGGPMQPLMPQNGSAMSTGLIFGGLGAVAAAAAAQFVPALGCVNKFSVPPGESYLVNGRRVDGGASGQTVDYGKGPSCMVTVSGGAFLGLFTGSAFIASSRHGAANDAYAEAMKRFPEERRQWVAEEQARIASQLPDVKFALQQDQLLLAQVQNENAVVKARNAKLTGAPVVYNRELDLADVTHVVGASQVASEVDQPPPPRGARNPNAVAIVIGNRDYRGSPSVDFAIRDAVAMRRYLVESFGFDSSRVLLDTNVTTGEMANVFGTTDATAGRLYDLTRFRDSVDIFVYYSGHGAPEKGQRFLVPVDADFNRLRATGYPIQQLYRNLGTLAKTGKVRSITVAIDACFSGMSDGGAVQAGRSGGEDVDDERDGIDAPRSAVFTAVSAKETARWDRDQGHGLFTYYFLKGLQGAAAAPVNGDGLVTAAQLQKYVYDNVSRFALEQLKGALQTPQANIVGDQNRPVLASRQP